MNFGHSLKRFLEVYLPEWKELANSQKLQPSARTIERWLKEKPPTHIKLKKFLDDINTLLKGKHDGGILSQADNLLKLRDEQMQQLNLHPDYHHFKEHTGEDEHDVLKQWYSLSPKEITIYITWTMHDLITRQMLNAIDKGTKTRILLISAKSSYLKDRWKRNQYPVGPYSTFLFHLKRLIQENNLTERSNFELRFYNDHPIFRAYVIDNKILFTVNWRQGVVSEKPHLSAFNSSHFSKHLINDINYIWEYTDNERYSPDLMEEYERYIASL